MDSVVNVSFDTKELKQTISKVAQETIDGYCKTLEADVTKMLKKSRNKITAELMNDYVTKEFESFIRDKGYGKFRNSLEEVFDNLFLGEVKDEIRHLCNSRINIPLYKGDLLHQQSFMWGWSMALWVENIICNNGTLDKKELENDVLDRAGRFLVHRVQMNDKNYERLANTLMSVAKKGD